METGDIVLKREELYDLVWTEPLSKLAVKIGISDVGLAKICKRLQIPRPEQGHWVRVKKNWPVKPRPPLPPVHDPALFQVVIEAGQRPASDPDRKLDADPLIIQERSPENKIHVPATLSSPHPLIKATAERARSLKPDKYGRISLRARECLDIHVSQASIPRALRIMNALIKAFEKRGMTLSVKSTEHFETRVFVRGEELSIGIYESSKQMPHVLTPSEKKEIEKYGHEPSWIEKYDYAPSGLFSLLTDTEWSYPTVMMKETPKAPIEENLNKAVIRLIKVAEAKKAKRLEWERREAEEEEARRRHDEIQRRKRDEQERYEQLLKQVNAWTLSNQIRAFIGAVAASAVREGGSTDPGSDLDKWIQWANQQADRIDPIHGFELYANRNRKGDT
jgi:hypothetical protein